MSEIDHTSLENTAPEQPVQPKRPIFACSILSSIILILLAIISLPFLGVALVMLNWAYRDIPRSGENLPTATQYSPDASNYSFYDRLLHQVCEFDIPEEAFLEMCKDKGWLPIPIETLKELPVTEYEEDDWPHLNTGRDVPVVIRRYVWDRAEHANCSPNYECARDPSGLAAIACSRAVPKGYYYEVRGSDGGGIKVVYDSETGRCYIHSSPW